MTSRTMSSTWSTSRASIMSALARTRRGLGLARSRWLSIRPLCPGTTRAKFTWAGFRLEEHRLTPDYHLTGYESFGDWPNLTAKLAERGFNEVELRKLLGLNFLRVFREVVG